MFMYDVMSEQEAMQERFQLLKEGEYDAVIESSLDKISANSGNPMMDITLQVFDENGKPHSVRDFLVFTKIMMWKVVHFADSAGLMKEYEEQKLCSDVARGSRVRVKITIEEGGIIPEDKLKGKPAGSKYPDKNKVEDYVKKEDQNPNPDVVPFEDDDVAF
jgi:hypothetical protein